VIILSNFPQLRSAGPYAGPELIDLNDPTSYVRPAVQVHVGEPMNDPNLLYRTNSFFQKTKALQLYFIVLSSMLGKMLSAFYKADFGSLSKSYRLIEQDP
jgi:hypothetical protein